MSFYSDYSRREFPNDPPGSGPSSRGEYPVAYHVQTVTLGNQYKSTCWALEVDKGPPRGGGTGEGSSVNLPSMSIFSRSHDVSSTSVVDIKGVCCTTVFRVVTG